MNAQDELRYAGEKLTYAEESVQVARAWYERGQVDLQNWDYETSKNRPSAAAYYRDPRNGERLRRELTHREKELRRREDELDLARRRYQQAQERTSNEAMKETSPAFEPFSRSC